MTAMPQGTGETFADLVEGYLQKTRMSRKQFAADAGVSTQQLSKWLQGQDFPREAFVSRLARCLNLPDEAVILAISRGKREKSELSVLRKEVRELRQMVEDFAREMAQFRREAGKQRAHC